MSGTATPPRAAIVDDSEVVLGMMRLVLQDEGWTVRGHLEAFGIDDELRAFSPDVILLDLSMPELTRALLPIRVKALRALGAKVVLHSARDDAALEILAAEVGADGHLAKTGDVARILAAVNEQLGPRS